MTAKTIFTKRGTKIRSASARRFILLSEIVEIEPFVVKNGKLEVVETGVIRRALIVKRSDNRATLEAFIKRSHRGLKTGATEFVEFTIVDTQA